jgi:hypothetical protein
LLSPLSLLSVVREEGVTCYKVKDMVLWSDGCGASPSQDPGLLLGSHTGSDGQSEGEEEEGGRHPYKQYTYKIQTRYKHTQTRYKQYTNTHCQVTMQALKDKAKEI